MKDYYMILGHPYSRVSVHTLLAVITFALVGSVGGIYFFMLQNQSESRQVAAGDQGVGTKGAADAPDAGVSAPPILKTVELSNGEEPETLAEILKLHLQASDYAQTESYVLSCKSLIDPADSSASIKALAPNLYTFSLEYNDKSASIDFGYDGENSWSEASSLVVQLR